MWFIILDIVGKLAGNIMSRPEAHANIRHLRSARPR